MLRVAIQNEALLRFDLGAVAFPSNAVVTSATLSLYTTGSVTPGSIWARYS